ncbi:MAG: adenosylcobinamide amidohydrolase [Candidatus Methanomethylophilaceae archaeon]
MSFEKVNIRIEHTGEFPVAVISLGRTMEFLSSAVFNGGPSSAEDIVIIEVPKDYNCEDPRKDIGSVIDGLELPSGTVGFMTAAEIEYVLTSVKTSYRGVDTMAIVTAGLSNQVIAGEELKDWVHKHEVSKKRAAALRYAGTINVIGISPNPLTDAAKVNAIIAMTEAKTAALRDLGYTETGTTSDAIAVVSPSGEDREQYAGTGLPLGISMARSVRSAVRRALIKRGDFPERLSDEERSALKEMYS